MLPLQMEKQTNTFNKTITASCGIGSITIFFLNHILDGICLHSDLCDLPKNQQTVNKICPDVGLFHIKMYLFLCQKKIRKQWRARMSGLV